MKWTFLLVDYENVTDVNLAAMPATSTIKIFVGKSQQTIPFALTRDAQRFGDRLEWVKIAGDGKNNLDFHLAYYLGRLVMEFPSAVFLILSKDKGFDSLIAHLHQQNVSCRRIDSLTEGVPSAALPGNGSCFERAYELLSHADKKARPRKRKTLTQHISSFFQKKLAADDLNRTVGEFFSRKLITESNNVLTYHF